MRATRRWVTPNDGKPRPPVLAPQTFFSKFPSRCAVCGGQMEAGEEVRGVRKEDGGRWTVWHNKSQCDAGAKAAGHYSDGAKPEPLVPDPTALITPIDMVDPLLTIFDEETRSA